MDPVTSQQCANHPDRVAGVSCQRCEKPICPTCMVQASVGFQCPECAGARTTKVVSGSAAFGNRGDPVATKVLIGINVAAWVLMVVVGGSVSGASGEVFVRGATWGPAVASGEWYRLLTGGFLHDGPLHLAMNMFLLWLLGQALEPALGRAQFVALYFVSLLGGALGVMLLDPAVPTLGASGAVFGLMGALTVLQMRAGQNPWQSGIATLIALNLVITFMIPNVSIGGHLGGLLAGAGAAFGLSVAARRRGDGTPRVAVSARLVLLAIVAGGLVVLAVAAVSRNNFLIVPG
ncbi:MAG: rhomboid family intramembrane serine protease [Microthrixaceae bacterium]|nr:rhomboid family intramembrane serine protease [Microthrixaceae bacterium]